VCLPTTAAPWDLEQLLLHYYSSSPPNPHRFCDNRIVTAVTSFSSTTEEQQQEEIKLSLEEENGITADEGSGLRGLVVFLLTCLTFIVEIAVAFLEFGLLATDHLWEREHSGHASLLLWFQLGDDSSF
jgi:hypothetical protein